MTSDILKRAAEVEWMPCPLCGAELQAEGDGVEHPASDTCPLDSLWLLPEHSAAWNCRIPDMAAAIAERDAEIERLTARAEAAEAQVANAGAVMVEAHIGRAASTSREVFADSCNHTMQAIDYMEQLLLSALSTLSPIAAAARVLLANTEAANDPEIGPWLRALAEQEKDE